MAVAKAVEVRVFLAAPQEVFLSGIKMDFYFPIADIMFNPLWIFILGLGVGFVSGMLGIGTGILITPILILLGFPSRIALASQLNAAIGANFAGFLGYWRKQDVDFALGGYLIIGSLSGALTEFFLLRWLYNVAASYGVLKTTTAIVLILLGFNMFYQAIRSLLTADLVKESVSMKRWMIYIPYHRIFIRTRTEISILIPLAVGFLAGLVTTSLGGGINTIMIPSLTYLIGRVSPSVTGTSFFVSFIVCLSVTFLHGLGTAPVDMSLVCLLTVSSAVGLKLGGYTGAFVSRVWLGTLGGLVIFGLGVKNILAVIELGGRRTKVILDDGVRHYLQDLVSAMGDRQGWLSQKILIFAHLDPVIYSATCVCLTISLAYVTDRIMHSFLYGRNHG